MRRITKWYNNRVLGSHPKGCQLCSLGGKLVLFVTGKCDSNCYYCPLTKERRKDITFANEQKINTITEAIEEAKMISALGAGITGGEPSLTLDRTISYLSALKNEFGVSFHCHLYTSKALTMEQLGELNNSGLDEIRFHPIRLELSTLMKETLRNAKTLDWSVGIEIPVIPDKEELISKIIDYSIETNLDFINLNELEITEENLEILGKMGYHSKNNVSVAVNGSDRLAFKILKRYKRAPIDIHFCSSGYKDGVQLKNRFLRRAKNFAKPFDEITNEGLLIRARVLVRNENKISEIFNRLIQDYDIDQKLLEIDENNLTIFLNWKIAKEIASKLYKQFENEISNMEIIHQYPYSNGIITYLEPIEEIFS